jgi:hypothetical protein
MLAHHGPRAGSSRASFVGDVYPPHEIARKITQIPLTTERNTTLNDGSTPPGRPVWKYAYENILWSKQGAPLNLPLNLRAVLQVLLRLSDHLGRVWWSQAAIAEHAGCTVRTLRRLLPALEARGYARIEPMTFRQLALAQATLGLPLPGRNDDGQGPDLITLLVDGKLATGLKPAARQKAVPRGQFVQGPPRTSLSFAVPENPLDPADNSSDDPRDLSVDLYRNGGDPRKTPHPSKNVSSDEHESAKVRLVVPTAVETVTTVEEKSDKQAWPVLQAAYDSHYRRVYHARPTNKPLAVESQLLMAGHLADMATLLQARFVERNIDPTTLDKSPIELLADEALRVWFDSSGTNDYLRRVSHRMSALPADLPYRVRKAIESLLERLAPKPEPRRVATPVLPLAHLLGQPLPAAMQPNVSLPRTDETVFVPSEKLAEKPAKPTVAKTNLPADVAQVLNGLSQHASLHDLAQTPTLAAELVTIAKCRGVSMPCLLDALEVAAKVCQRQRMASSSVRSGIVYKFILERFDEEAPLRSTA